MSPTAERACWSCGAAFRSDLRWKVPLIIFLFAGSFLLSVAAALVMALLG